MGIKDQIRKPMVGNFISLVLLQGVNYLLPLISFPFLFRMIEVERFGLVEFGYAIMQYMVMFTDFGFNNSGVKYIAMNRERPDIINRYLNSVMIGRFFLCAVAFLILLLLVTVFERFRIESTFYLLFFGMVIGNALFPMWFFQGMEKMKFITIFNLVSKGLSFIPFFIFIRRPEHYILAPVFYSIGYILAGAVSLYFIYRKMNMKWFLPAVKDVTFALKDSSNYFLSRISTSLFTTSNAIVIGLVFNNTTVGYYAAAEKIYKAYNQLLLPFTGVLFPHMAKTRDVSFFKRVFKWVNTVNVPLVALVMILSSFIMWVIYGASVPEAVAVFRILIIACFLTIPSMLLGYPFLAAIGHPNYTNLTSIITSVIHIAGLFLLYIFGLLSIYTVAMMVVFSETSMFILRVWGVKRFNLFKQTL